jgi:hypothetical protein
LTYVGNKGKQKNDGGKNGQYKIKSHSVGAINSIIFLEFAEECSRQRVQRYILIFFKTKFPHPVYKKSAGIPGEKQSLVFKLHSVGYCTFVLNYFLFY